MKTPFISFTSFPKTLAAVALAMAGVIASPSPAEAKPNKKKKSSSSSHHRKDRHDRHDDHDHDRRTYYSRPSSSFVLTLGTGYAGRGYYYGPPGASYYHNAPGVRYYSSRSSVPRQYWGSTGSYDGGYSRTEASVQAALARRGYYNGPIDGDIGSGSRRAIARFQANHGLTPTGSINQSLLRALGL
jgi:hypothetical protein